MKTNFTERGEISLRGGTHMEWVGVGSVCVCVCVCGGGGGGGVTQILWGN